MASFNFKSSGVKAGSRLVSPENFTKKVINIGIKTPVSNNKGDQIFDMITEPVDQIKDNLRNLVLTNHGERLGLFDFGADLQTLLFELGNTESFETEAADRIEKAIEKYMPGIQIDEIAQVELDKHEKEKANVAGFAKVRLRITYSIPTARVGSQALEVTLQNGG